MSLTFIDLVFVRHLDIQHCGLSAIALLFLIAVSCFRHYTQFISNIL